MNKFEKVELAKKEYEDSVKAITRDDIVDLVKPLFEKHPKVAAVRWRQYTPYFNDGDPCRFSVHEAYLQFEDSDEEGGDYEDGFSGWGGDDPERKAALDDFDTELAVEEDIMKRVFGDHVRVTIERDGAVEVDEYDHS